MFKKELEKNIETLRESVSKWRDKAYVLEQERENLKTQLSEKEMENDNLKNHAKSKGKMLQSLVKILAGEASPKSKQEVMTDLLYPYVKNEKEQRRDDRFPFMHGNHRGLLD